jgi:hypothetical protein
MANLYQIGVEKSNRDVASGPELSPAAEVEIPPFLQEENGLQRRNGTK